MSSHSLPVHESPRLRMDIVHDFIGAPERNGRKRQTACGKWADVEDIDQWQSHKLPVTCEDCKRVIEHFESLSF